MPSNEEIDKFVQHYHRHGNSPDAAQFVHPELTRTEATIFGGQVLRSTQGQRRLIQMKKETAVFAPLSEYIQKLEEIRDKALDNGKFAPAVQAHMVIGKLAGYFDRPEADPAAIGDASAISSEELLKRIERLTQQQPKIIELRPENNDDDSRTE